MDRTEVYKGFEIRAYEREPQRWRAEIRKADGSMLEILVADSGRRIVDYYDRRYPDSGGHD